MFRVKDLKKAYVTTREEVRAVQGISFEVSKGEIFTLLGPSGCGKSTTLRCVAGLEVPDEGEIWLGERLVFSSRSLVNVSPDQRDIGMVFQSYAVWPHMTVFENVAFPLRHGPYRLAKREVREKVMRALKLVQMEAMAERPTPLLSGGQQQRVALARALVYEPSVLLLDEPLSNLDAKLRVEMRSEIKALIKQLQVTALYVTHDQEEGLLLSDRIAVMQHGEILQEGSPRDIYLHPANAYVAAFVGQANLFEGNVEGNQGGGTVVKCGFGKVIADSANASEPSISGEAVRVIIRPEDIVIHSELRGETPNIFPAEVVQMLFIGSRIHCELQIGGYRCHAELAGRSMLNVGQRVAVELPRERVGLIRR